MREGIDGAGLRRDTEVWRTLLEAMWANSQPGIIFIDRVNRDNNLAAIERLSACNPCAEQYLPAYGACNLASINLARLVCAPFTRQAAFDWPAFDGLVAIGVRLLDNVLTLNRWPLREQALEAESKRRIGLGFTGLADALCMLGLRYDGEAARITAALIARRLRDRAYECSIDLAVERGAYPRFEARSQLRSPSFSSRLPEALKRRISRFGLRNSHLLCVAPTGSISIAFGDNCSTGIEPIFRARYRRWVRGIGGERSPFEAENHAARRWRETFPNGSELPPAWCDSSGVDPTDQLRMVGAIQDFIDSGISKTVQLPQDYDQHRLEALVWLAWHRGLKGFTVYRPRHWQEGVLQSNA